jgi:hypothetical protein
MSNSKKSERGCSTQEFVLIPNEPEVVAHIRVDNEKHAPSMSVKVHQKGARALSRAIMLLRITRRQPSESEPVLWVLERDTLTLRGFPDEATYAEATATVLERIRLDCL